MDAPLRKALGLVATLGALAWAPCVAQEGGTILGTIRDLRSGLPLVGARVAVEGTRINATTDGVGRYQLLNLSPGTHFVRIEAPGYTTLVEQIQVQASRMTVAHFHLPLLAVMIDRLVVTAGPPEDRTVRVTAEAAELAPAATLADILERAIPGLEVLRGSGQVGAGTRVRLRGPKGLMEAATPPLVFVDGMRVAYAGAALGSGPAGPSIFDLIDVSMIEEIELLRGAEAAEYGLGAASGVILITTRKGRR